MPKPEDLERLLAREVAEKLFQKFKADLDSYFINGCPLSGQPSIGFRAADQSKANATDPS